MINCGGMVDASLYIDTPANVTMYIIDSHRPLNLDNLFSGTQVAVFDDDEDDETAKELMDAYENVAVSASLISIFNCSMFLCYLTYVGSMDHRMRTLTVVQTRVRRKPMNRMTMILMVERRDHG
jgi:hypothetical protein